MNPKDQRLAAREEMPRTSSNPADWARWSWKHSDAIYEALSILESALEGEPR